nr:uncharacterized protein LOC133618913 [Nerophis lumbriciformis]
MSGGINVRSTRQPPPPSGIPLPRTLLPTSPKRDRHHRTSDIPRALTHSPKHTPRHTPTQSPSLCPRRASLRKSSHRDLQTDTGLKSPLHRTGDINAHQISSSAYNSPLIQRRVPPPQSKDTLDLVKPTHPRIDVSLDSNCNRNPCTNRNQSLTTSNLRLPLQFRRVDHFSSNVLSYVVPVREEEAPKIDTDESNNGNIYEPHTQNCDQPTISGPCDSTTQSDEEMGTPEEPSGASSTSLPLLPPGMLAMPLMSKRPVGMLDEGLQNEPETSEIQGPRVNMAAVAPFSFRLQVQEGDLSLDELSDCSSGSIEICCDDLTPVGCCLPH